jgi:diadenosine tetraphosphate (Ap4A) HIT family hydrolase
MIDHAAKLHELPDEYLADVMPIAKKIATAQGLENYNILQVRFHMKLTFPSPRSLLFNLQS